jgi:D-sedoheptulose 7-phosphate isomerase
MTLEKGSTATTDADVVTDYVSAFSQLLHDLDVIAMTRVLAQLERARDCQATVFIAGNGGSAATASHWASDLRAEAGGTEGKRFRTRSLTENVSRFTAIANDTGFENVFSLQLEQLGESGDVFVAVSASGRSPNLVRALEVAGEREITSIALVGFDGGILRTIADYCIFVETASGEYGLVESAHAVICDIMTAVLAHRVNRSRSRA